MKNIVKLIAAVLLAAMTLSFAVSCGGDAPSGMYNPSNGENFLQGVENVIFSVPEDFKITMSANMLAAVKGNESFSLQCRHSDYYYKDGLSKNYNELKADLVGMYGPFTETLTEDLTVAGQKALEARYHLTIAGNEYSYIQYLFYNGVKHFYLFTYCCPVGTENEELLGQVLSTVSFDTENYTAPAGFRKVENAEADSIASDRYEIFCPDEWIVDNSTGLLVMRVPSSSILSNISFSEIGTGENLDQYIEEYCAKVAPGLELSGDATETEKYIAASVYQMMDVLKDFKLIPIKEDSKIYQDQLLSASSSYINSYTNSNQITLFYIDFTASLSDFNAHGSGSLFTEGSAENKETSYATYKFRQYFVIKNNYLYLFTYTASENRFDAQLEDAQKVVKFFNFKGGKES